MNQTKNNFSVKKKIQLLSLAVFVIIYYLILTVFNFRDPSQNKFTQIAHIFFLFILIFQSIWIYYQFIGPFSRLSKKIINLKKKFQVKEKNYFFSKENSWPELDNLIENEKDRSASIIEELFLENQKISLLIESIVDPILAIDKNGHFLFMNDYFKEQFISQNIKANELIELNFKNVIRDLKVQNTFDRTMTEKSNSFYSGYKDIGRSNLNVYFDISVFPLKDSTGEIIGAIGNFHNVTEKILADKMRENFVANVSHEVRTPLTAIKGYVQMLKSTEHQFPKDTVDCLNRIESNTERLANLYNDILNLSVIESKQEIYPEQISTKDITERVIMNVRQGKQEEELDIQLTIIEETVYADPNLLEQLITNLLENAIKYSNNPIKIQIRWFKEKNFSVFRIEDNGVGIPKKLHSRIFERFFRVDNSRTGDTGGTGLGLAIVKHIIQRHNGKIMVEGDEGQGSQFTVWLPKKVNFSQK